MKVFITGGTGFIGRQLVDTLTREGNRVMVLTRSASGKAAGQGIELVEGDPKKPGPWQDRVREADWIINLAGATIARKWNDEIKKEIYDSRIYTTRNLVDAIPSGSPITLFSTSAVGYYGFHGDEKVYENEPAGNDFLGRLAADWEAEAMKATGRAGRIVIPRFGVVLGEKGGFLNALVPLFRKYLGGPAGSGTQWLSWIHREDLVAAFSFMYERKHISGPVNITSPNPVTNAEFAKALGAALGVPAIVPAPAFGIKLVLGEFASVIVNGQRVLPGVLAREGFAFRHPDIGEALKSVAASF